MSLRKGLGVLAGVVSAPLAIFAMLVVYRLWINPPTVPLADLRGYLSQIDPKLGPAVARIVRQESQGFRDPTIILEVEADPAVFLGCWDNESKSSIPNERMTLPGVVFPAWLPTTRPLDDGRGRSYILQNDNVGVIILKPQPESKYLYVIVQNY